VNERRIRRRNRAGALLAALVLCGAAAGPAKVASDLDRFRYQPSKIKVGEVAHYVKSNLDGTKPTRVSIFVVAPDRLEVAKVEREVIDAAWVRAHFDWTLFTSDRMEAAVINLDGSVEERALFAVDRAKGEVDVSVGDRKGSAAWQQLPFHVYNFDFTSLNFAWRHLVDPKKPFTIGIIDPTFQKEGDLIFYRGDARIEYERDETFKGKKCRRYRISGPGIENAVGVIWQDTGSGWLERIQIPFRDNPDWNSFKLDLLEIEKMTPAAWKKFVADSLAKANAANAKG
jgi:hypothetical protein